MLQFELGLRPIDYTNLDLMEVQLVKNAVQ